MKFTKKILSVTVVFCMVIMLMSSLAVSATETILDIANGSIPFMESGGNKTVNMKPYTGSVTITGTHTNNFILINNGEHNITLDNATFPRIMLTSKAKLNLTLVGNNTIDGSESSVPGIYVPKGAQLVITEESTGTLTAKGASGMAGIGGMTMDISGSITINGGTVTAIGGSGAAGIGCSDTAETTSIVINGGNVTAVGGNGAAGIGGGTGSNGEGIVISGGTVTSTGGSGAGAIGMGVGGTAESVSVSPTSGQKVIVKENEADDAVLGEYSGVADITSLVSGKNTLYITAVEAGIGGMTGDVSWSLDADGVFTVSGEGAMEDYTSADEVPWKDNVASIKSVIIGEGVTRVSDYGFYGCTNLESITFQNEYLYRIGECSFYSCEKLKTVTLPKGLKEIGYGAFGCDEANTGLETVHFPAKNCSFNEHYNEETYESDDAATFPVHTVIYGYPGTTADWYCERNDREFVAFESGYIFDIDNGESLYNLNRTTTYEVDDLWKAIEVENGSSDSINYDYTITIDANDAPEIFNYMVDSESYHMNDVNSNDARIEVEAEFSFSGPSYSVGSLRKTATYSFNESDIKGNMNDDYLNWQHYGSDDSLISVSANGSVLTITLKGTLKELYDKVFEEYPDGMDERLCEVGFYVNIKGITSYRGPYNTVRDTLKQLEFVSNSIYDAHDYYVDRVDKWALSFDNSFEVFTWAFAEGQEGFYDIVAEDYYWTYEFKKEAYYWDYDEETGEETEDFRGDVEYPANGKTVSTEICSDGKEYGIAIGECSTGSKNYLTLRDILTDENRSFLESFVGLKPSGEGGPVYISWNCTATLTFEDGTKAVYDVSGGDEMMHLVAPCVHSCRVCGACTEKDRSLPCNFSYRQYEPLFVCSCDEPTESDIVVENVSTTSATTANMEAPVTVVIERVDMDSASDSAFVEHVTQEITEYEIEEIYNVDIYDEYSGNPYMLNQWGGSEESLEVAIPINADDAEALQNGDASLYHIDGDGSAEEVEGVTIEFDGETPVMNFTSDTFSPFIIAKKGEVPTVTSVTVTKDTDVSTCTVTYTVTSEDLAKAPVMYIAFYDSRNALVAVTVKDNDIVSSDEITISIPSGSEKCEVMLWTPQLTPLCIADDCQLYHR